MLSIRDAMMASLSVQMLERDVVSTAASVKTTFSSWDNCMAKSYCKWPVIAGIVIGGLILLSVISCIVRCACCGVSCCCSCFSCLKCCGDCCGCCDDPRQKKHKHLDEEYFKPQGPAHAGYAAPAPMMAGGLTPGAGAAPPQYAQFEVGPNGHAIAPAAKVNEDALPPMPSWETASKKRVSIHEEKGVELEELDKRTGQKMPLMSGAGSMGMASPAPSPYSEQPVQGHDYITGGAMASGAAIGGGGGVAAMGGRSPHDPYNQPRGPGSAMGYRGPGTPLNAPISPYNNPASPARGPGGNGSQYDDYFDQQNSRIASPQPAFAGAAGGAYGRPNPGPRGYSNASQASNAGMGMGMGMRGTGYPPSGPQQQHYNNDRGMDGGSSGGLAGPASRSPYSSPHGGEMAMPAIEMPSADDHRVASPLQNSGGFDFGAGQAHGHGHDGYGNSSSRGVGGGYSSPSPPPANIYGGLPQQQQQQQQQQYGSRSHGNMGMPSHQRDQSQAYEMEGSGGGGGGGGYQAYGAGNHSGGHRW